MFGHNSGKSTPLNRAVNNLQGKLKNSFLNAYPHYTVPGYNLSINPNVENYDEEHLMQLFRKFPYDSDLPRPLLPPARLPQCVLKNQDPALQLLSSKSEFKYNVNRIIQYHEKYKNDLTICNKKDIKWQKNANDTAQTSVPRYIAELAEVLDCDPDPQFKGEYDWYYTGGSLNHLILSGQNILIFPYAEELVAAPIVEKSQLSWKPNLKNTAKCDLGSTLYEIRHNIMSDNTCKIIAREKNSCTLYSLSEIEETLELCRIHQQSSALPYVSADLNLIGSKKYCVANCERSVEFRDLHNLKYLISTSIPKARNLPDNWMSVKFHESDANLITIIDRCCLYYLDLRTPLDGPSLTLCPKNNLEICESLSLTASSKHNPFYQYLGTYHNLLLCDSRFGNSTIVQKWTHQFKSTPLFCAIIERYQTCSRIFVNKNNIIIYRNDEEIITLSSQLSGENSVILNTWSGETKMHSYSLPCMPLTISDTLRACQDEGKCLDPNMRSRLELCTAGTTLSLNHNNDVTFFTQNSIGDVFYQCITHEKLLQNISEINKKSLLTLDAWEEACLNQSKTVKPLVVSETVNMEHILNGMKNGNLRLESTTPGTTNFFPRWFQSIERLNSYVDILAPELLAVWDIRQGTIPATVTSHQKVLHWLEKETSQNLSQSQDDTSIFNGTNEIFSQELISVSQNIQKNYTPDNILAEQIVNDLPASVPTRKKVAKKRKYVAGF